MSMLLLYVVSWVVIQLEEMKVLRASLKSTLHHDLQLCSDVMRQVKHVFLEALWQPRQDTNQGKWLVPAQPHVQLSPTFSCHMTNSSPEETGSPLLPHKHQANLNLFLIWTSRGSFWGAPLCVWCDLRLTTWVPWVAKLYPDGIRWVFLLIAAMFDVDRMSPHGFISCKVAVL